MTDEKEFASPSITPKFISKYDNLEEDFDKNKILSIQRLIKTNFSDDLSVDIEKLKTMEDFHKKYGETRISLENVEKNALNDEIAKWKMSNVYEIFEVKNENECHIFKEFELAKDFINEKEKLQEIVEMYHLINYTNLLKYHEIYYDKENKKLLLTMEPLQITLKQFVEKKHRTNGDGVNEYQCKLIICDILSNLWTLHKTGNVHCDIKPSHIMYEY